MRANLVIEQLRAVLLRDGAGLTDGQLLECFIARRENAAFEALVRRHGPMVLAVCRRVLRNHHDSEDAFQATFIVLARKAASILPREKLGVWLHGVAYRTALKAKATTAKRREHQVREMPEPEAPKEDGGCELQQQLDKELNCLQDKYRAPLILCGLEGMTEKEAARQLGLPQGTLSSRLSRARALLAKRLSRRGVALSLTGILSQNTGSACVPATLLDSTIKAASLGRPAIVSAKVAALTEGVLTAMLFSKIKVATLVMLIVVGTVFGTGTVILSVSRAKEKDGQEQPAPAPPKEIVGEVTLAELRAAYSTNDALGDERFAGKRFRVTAKMFAVRRMHGSYWMTTYRVKDGYLAIFKFTPDHRKQLAGLKEGQELTIEGRCEGRIQEAGETRPEFGGGGEPRIDFSDCKIVSVNK